MDSPEELAAAIDDLRRDYRQPILVEEYIEGDELTVGVIGNDPPRVIGVMRVLPQQTDERFVYSLEVKRDWEQRVRYECPAQLPAECLQAIEDAALKSLSRPGMPRRGPRSISACATDVRTFWRSIRCPA